MRSVGTLPPSSPVHRPRAGLPWLLTLTALAGVAALGCGGSPTAPSRDEVFYLHATGIIDRNASWEVYFKPLDLPSTERVPRIVGVGLMNGDVRMGRPIDWYIRSADYTPQHRFISYQSPRQFLFSIYERIDSPEDTWTDVLRRYEADVDEQGSQILAARMPIATANTQGRSYILKTRVPARPDFLNYSHEILIRSDHRLLLVQIIHGENIESTADEMAAALKSITVY
jgi:hypothetical protein